MCHNKHATAINLITYLTFLLESNELKIKCSPYGSMYGGLKHHVPENASVRYFLLPVTTVDASLLASDCMCPLFALSS
jgi:hypothetical protein